MPLIKKRKQSFIYFKSIIIIFIIIILAIIGLEIFEANAQELQNKTNGNSNGQAVISNDANKLDEIIETPKIDIKAIVKENILLEEKIPLAIDMRLTNMPADLAILANGVTAKAYARFLTVDGQKIGQVILTAVEKNGKTEPLVSDNFTSQFNMDDKELKPLEPVVISSNREELKAALEKLNIEDEDEEDKEKRVVDGKGKNNNLGVGSNSTKNDQASGYKTPEKIDRKDVKMTVKTTTEGCDVKIDTAQGVAIVQSKLQTFEDGVLKDDGVCSDNGTRYQLKKSYKICDDKEGIDLKTLKVTSQYQTYYLDGATKKINVGVCVPDSEKIFNIVEKHDGCPISLDYEAKKAIVQSSLIYINDNNAEIEVRSCQASTSKEPVALTKTTNGCNIRHDFDANKSYQQKTWIYQLKGQTYQAGTCMDDEPIFSHKIAYKDNANVNLCNPIINMATKKVTLQSKKYINVASTIKYITECTPNKSSISIASTTDTCGDMANWTHDLASAQSFGQERFYYMDGATREYVGNCQNSEITYKHQVETAGYQFFDSKLYSLAKTTTYINTPFGRHNIKTGEIKAGTLQVSYIYQSTSKMPTGNKTYTSGSCDATIEMADTKIWLRPDATNYNQAIGKSNGASVYSCSSSGSAVWQRTSSDSGILPTYTSHQSHSDPRFTKTSCQPCLGHYTYCNSSIYKLLWLKQYYRGEKKLTRDDGKIFTKQSSNTQSTFKQYCVFDKKITGTSYYTDYNGIPPSYFLNSPATTYNSSWDAAEGW